MGKKLSQSEFVTLATNRHHGRYNYENSKYIRSGAKVAIMCPVHGEFWQIANDHLNGSGCKKCTVGGIWDLKSFIDKANKVHNNKYSYDNAEFTRVVDKITITCPIHGNFEQTASDHLNKCGCGECSKESMRNRFISNTEVFTENAVNTHGDKYDYSSVAYKGAKVKVEIICPKHGSFWQTPNDHLNGCGCRHCRTESVGWTDTKWKEQATKSNQFQDFKLYIVKIFNDEESFVKVGKTFVSFDKRFSDISQYYHYKVLHTVTADADTICKLERRIIHNNKGYRYVPKTQFNGHTECFTQITYEGNVYAN